MSAATTLPARTPKFLISPTALAQSTTNHFIKLALTLPPPLQHFFARFPPGTHTNVHSNPFKPTFFSTTGKWHNPIYSLRRQADLCKLARKHGVEELLPPSRKSRLWKAERALEGKKMKRMLQPKGHVWERTLHARLEKTRKAMEKMPEMIEKWKRAGHGRGWKDWPNI